MEGKRQREMRACASLQDKQSVIIGKKFVKSRPFVIKRGEREASEKRR